MRANESTEIGATVPLPEPRAFGLLKHERRHLWTLLLWNARMLPRNRWVIGPSLLVGAVLGSVAFVPTHSIRVFVLFALVGALVSSGFALSLMFSPWMKLSSDPDAVIYMSKSAALGIAAEVTESPSWHIKAHVTKAPGGHGRELRKLLAPRICALADEFAVPIRARAINKRVLETYRENVDEFGFHVVPGTKRQLLRLPGSDVARPGL